MEDYAVIKKEFLFDETLFRCPHPVACTVHYVSVLQIAAEQMLKGELKDFNLTPLLLRNAEGVETLREAATCLLFAGITITAQRPTALKLLVMKMFYVMMN